MATDGHWEVAREGGGGEGEQGAMPVVRKVMLSISIFEHVLAVSRYITFDVLSMLSSVYLASFVYLS